MQLGIKFDLNEHIKRQDYRNKLLTFQRILEQAQTEEDKESAQQYVEKYQRLLDELDAMYVA